jgi:hypothetical protein
MTFPMSARRLIVASLLVCSVAGAQSASTEAEAHSANNKRYAAEGLAAAGVAAAGVAVWLFVRSGSGEHETTTALAPVIDQHGGMLVLTGAIP